MFITDESVVYLISSKCFQNKPVLTDGGLEVDTLLQLSLCALFCNSLIDALRPPLVSGYVPTGM